MKITKKYDLATTPSRRAERHTGVGTEDKNILTDTHTQLNPAAIQREIQALTEQLLKITTSKATAPAKPSGRATRTRASVNESTKPVTRAS